jgi:hypothetical protein
MEVMVSVTPRPLYSRGNSPQYLLDRKPGWAPEPVWTLWRRENYKETNISSL